jgi:hypothetical protein
MTKMPTSVRSDYAGIQNDKLGDDDDDDDDLESNISEPDEPEEEPDSQTDPVVLDLVDMISRFPAGGGQAGDAKLCDTVSDVTDIEQDVIDENAEISDKNELFPDADTTWTLGEHFS